MNLRIKILTWHLECLKEFDRLLWKWHRMTRARRKKIFLELLHTRMTIKPHKPLNCDNCGELTHFSIKNNSLTFCLNCYGFLAGYEDRKFSSNYKP